jgi:hypothetical protein
MTWSTPLTAVSNAALTAAQWNGSVRDNLLATAPALATTAGYHFASVGANQIAERAILTSAVNTSETTASTTYVDLATVGPTVTCATGTQALVWLDLSLSNSSGTSFSAAAVAISGASSFGPAIDTGVTNVGSLLNRAGVCWLATGLTSGSNQFKLQYRVNAGTGTYASRSLTVMAL